MVIFIGAHRKPGLFINTGYFLSVPQMFGYKVVPPESLSGATDM